MREKNGSPPTFLPPPQSEEAEFNLVCQLRPWPGKSPGTAPLHSQGPVQVGVAVRIIRAGETVDARSTPGAAAVAIDDTGETQKAAPTVFGNQDAFAQRSSPGLASNRANRHTSRPPFPRGSRRSQATRSPEIGKGIAVHQRGSSAAAHRGEILLAFSRRSRF